MKATATESALKPSDEPFEIFREWFAEAKAREPNDPDAMSLATVDATGLRVLVGFGSIIARIGLPGEAHYALANEAMAREVEAFGAALCAEIGERGIVPGIGGR